ncbi:MAG: sel1 repeat family protein, partial [Campylobacteraceae bacterium]|nr:sel1 repeat family protein [Campylobacteraceae bacterium]
MKTVLKWLIGAVLLGSLALADDFDEANKTYENGNYEKAAELFKKSCDGGNAKSCGSLGFMYKSGKGVKQDYFKAVELYKKGCDGGNAWSCGSLGLMYKKGEGIKQDYFKAV